MNRTLERALEGRRTLAVIVAVILVQSVFLWSSSVDMASMWLISVYRHCWLIVPFVLVLVNQRGAELDSEPFSLNIFALLVLPLLALMLFIGDRASIRALEHLSLVAIVFTSILAVIGWKKFRVILFPLCLLFAAVPIGDFMVPTLMDWTADIATFLLELTGIPAWREGALISLPHGIFHVAEVCSGISFVLASLTLSLVYSYLFFVSIRKRALFVTLTLVAYVLLNGLRAFLVIIVANASELRWFTGYDHIYFGQFLFFCLAITLFFLGRRWSDSAHESNKNLKSSSAYSWHITRNICFSVLLTFGLLQTVDLVFAPRLGDQMMPTSVVRVAECKETSDWAESFVPELAGASSSDSMSFACQGRVVGAFTAYFNDPQQGSELVNKQHKYWPESWENIGRHSSYTARLGHTDTDVAELSFQRAGKTRVVWYLYAIGSHLTANRYAAKFWEAFYSVTGANQVGALYLFTTEVSGDSDAARQALATHLTLNVNSEASK